MRRSVVAVALVAVVLGTVELLMLALDGDDHATVVLGRPWAPTQQGFGDAAPRQIDMGGDPGSVVEDITWTSWGGPRAVGHGFAYDAGGASSMAEARRTPAEVVAFDLGRCGGRMSYRKLTWYFPSRGDRFDAGDATDPCTGESPG